jgi:SAM-dependent methyltransferase
MTDSGVDVRSYFEPEDITALASFEARHYWHLARRKVILDALPRVGPDARHLDIGCGPGTTTTFFNAQHHTVDYADVHPEGLKLAAALATEELGSDAASRRRFLQLDICADPLPPGYAGVLLLDVIEHLPDDVAALRNVRAGLNAGDHLIVTVPAFPRLWSRFDEIARHKRRYTLGTARSALEAAGFDVEHATYFFAPLFIAASVVHFGRDLRNKLPARWRAHDEGLEGLMETRTSPLLTKMLVWILGIERPIVRRWRLPFGTSVLCVARAR